MSILAQDPLRAIAWRWDRAIVLSKAKKIEPTKLDDDEVVAAARYIKKYDDITRKLGTDDDKDRAAAMLELQETWPDLATAVNIHKGRKFMRYAIEALVCTQATASEIAKPFGVSESVVLAYEAYFFDVRSRIDNNLWVTHALMSEAVRDGLATADWDYFWKGLALWYDKDVLQAYWGFGRLPSDVHEKIAEFNQSLQLRNVAKAHLVRPVTPHHAHDIIDEANAAQGDTEDAARDALLSGAGQMLAAMTFRIASQTDMPSAIERPMQAVDAEIVHDDVPELPAEGIMAGRIPDESKREGKPVGVDDVEDAPLDPKPAEPEKSNAAVKSKPKREHTPVTLEEEREAANDRIRKKRDAILAKKRAKEEQN